MASYKRLQNGDWGVCVEGTVRVGEMVIVRTRSGQIKRETVQHVLWTGNGVSVCAVQRNNAANWRRRPGSPHFLRRMPDGDLIVSCTPLQWLEDGHFRAKVRQIGRGNLWAVYTPGGVILDVWTADGWQSGLDR